MTSNPFSVQSIWNALLRTVKSSAAKSSAGASAMPPSHRPVLEALEDRTLPSVSMMPDSSNPGKFVVSFSEDVGGTNDTLTLRMNNAGELEHNFNSAGFSKDLDPAPGIQPLLLSAISRIDVSLGAGDDTLSLNFSNGSPIPSSGIAYDGGAGSDTIMVAASANMTIYDTPGSPHDARLDVAPGGAVALTSVSLGILTGGNSTTIINGSGWAGGSIIASAGNAGDVAITGTPNDDVLAGGNGKDVLVGGAGNDTLIGGNGQDVLLGGAGDDDLMGGSGNDQLDGGDGFDRVVASGSKSYVLSNNQLKGDGTDSLANVEGAFLTVGTKGSVDASAFTGDARLVGSDGDDHLIGGSGNDVIEGGAGNDLLEGRGGNDLLKGGSGDDTLKGGDGDDVLDGGAGSDSIDGGAGTNQVAVNPDVSGGAPLNVTIQDGMITGGQGTDTFANTQTAAVAGSAGNDTVDATNFTGNLAFFAGAGDDTVMAGKGANFLDGGDGNDFIFGGSGNSGGFTSSLIGGAGNDFIFGGDNNSGGFVILDGGDGDDFIFGGGGNSGGFTATLSGGAGNDWIYGGDNNSGGFVTLDGGDGDDFIFGGGGNGSGYTTSLSGGAGNDFIFGGDNNGSGFVTLDGGDGDDFIFGGGGNGSGYTTSLSGGSGNAFIFGGDNNGSGFVVADGGDGDDFIFGGGNNGSGYTTSLSGGAGNDFIFGGAGNGSGYTISLSGGAGNDFIFGGGNNGSGFVSLDGGAGDDFIFGGAGNGSGYSTSLSGGSGNDFIFGGDNNGSGFVVADGGDGDDFIFGGGNNGSGYAAEFSGGSGNDFIFGGDNNGSGFAATLSGGSGNDFVFGGDNNGSGYTTSLSGGAGNDFIFGGDNNGSGYTATLSGDDGNDFVFGGGGNGSGFNVLDGGGGNDTLQGGAGGGDVLSGGDGDDVYLIDASVAGNVTINEAPNLGSDTLDFSDTDTAVTVDLSSTAPQIVTASGFELTLSPDGLENVVGTRHADTLIGNGRDNTLTGSDQIVTILDNPPENNGIVQTVYLSFDAETDPGEHVYTATERAAIQAVMEEHYEGFNVVFTQTVPATGPYATIFFNQNEVAGNDFTFDGSSGAVVDVADDTIFVGELTGLTTGSTVRYSNGGGTSIDTADGPLDGTGGTIYYVIDAGSGRLQLADSQENVDLGTAIDLTGVGTGSAHVLTEINIVDGGKASEIDFLNTNPEGTAAVNVNNLIEPDDDVTIISANVASHELGHLLGLKHIDASSPPAFGIPPTVPRSEFLPDYPGLAFAYASFSRVMASPGSIGSTIDDVLQETVFSLRSATKLRFNEVADVDNGMIVAEQSAPHDSLATAQSVALTSFGVPNTVKTGLNATKGVVASAVAVTGEIELVGGVSENDFYSFVAPATGVVTIEVISNGLAGATGEQPIVDPNTIDPILRVYDSEGVLVATNDDELEIQDAIVLDLLLIAGETYYVEVDTFADDTLQPPVPDTDVGSYVLFVYAIETGHLTDQGDVLNGGAGNDVLIGNQGADELTGGTGSDLLRGGEDGDTYFWGAGDGRDTFADGGTTGTDTIISSAAALEALPSDFSISASGIDVIQSDGLGGIGNDFGDNQDLTFTNTNNATIAIENGDLTIRGVGNQQKELDTITFESFDVAGLQNVTISFEFEATVVDGEKFEGADTLDVRVLDETGAEVLSQQIFNGNAPDKNGQFPRTTYSLNVPDSAQAITIVFESSIRTVEETYFIDNVFIRPDFTIVGTEANENWDFSGGQLVDATIFTLGGDDVIVGTSEADFIDAGAGNDTIDGGLGADVIIGGLGADAFIFNAGEGAVRDTIVDFAPDVDQITFRGFEIGGSPLTFADLQFSEQTINGSTGTLITLPDGREIALFGVSLDLLDEDDFVFVPGA